MPHLRRGQQDYQELLLRAGGGETRRTEGERPARHLSTPECKALALHGSDAIPTLRASAHPAQGTNARTAPGRLDGQTYLETLLEVHPSALHVHGVRALCVYRDVFECVCVAQESTWHLVSTHSS